MVLEEGAESAWKGVFMGTTLTFCLGVVSALVVILFIALVVVTLMLMSKVQRHSYRLNGLDKNFEELERKIAEESDSINRRVDEETINCLNEAKSHADSRFDKLVDKVKA
jgi:hypothetical protein